ncbi:PH domain-containing protein [Paraflavitalea pollutisoli]|uniref:PH domain-containing protein n=1 Tax=Paraflavitalea pollutisoli TaxID=3034143 RepID=UPI0023EDEEE5|nr:PH domain-containing protein [Paraflavitalea sp. H1-2-19X]
MEFLNNQLPIDELPRVENVALSPIERNYLKVLRWEWTITTLLLAVAIGFLLYFVPALRRPLPQVLLPGAWVLLTGAWFFIQEKAFAVKAFAIRDRDIIYRSGWIIQRTHTCPFNRIQHSAVTIGPLEKQFGLASLVLYTAGSNEADLRVRGLTESTAWELKEWITQKIVDEPAD